METQGLFRIFTFPGASGGEGISGSRRPETAPPGEGPPEPRKSLSMQLSCFHPPLVRICLSFLGISAASLAQLRIAEGHQAFEEIPYTVLHCNPSFRFRWFASEQAAGLPTAVLMEIIAARRGNYFQHFALFPLFPWPHEAPRGRRHRTRFSARNGFPAGKSPRFPFWPSGRSPKIFYRILRRPPKTVRSSGPSGRTCGVLSSSLINRRPGQSPPRDQPAPPLFSGMAGETGGRASGGFYGGSAGAPGRGPSP